MTLSSHARFRWAGRFPHLDPQAEWKRATQRRMSKRLLNALRKRAAIVKGRKYFISPNGVVFVVAGGEKVVTVFSMEQF